MCASSGAGVVGAGVGCAASPGCGADGSATGSEDFGREVWFPPPSGFLTTGLLVGELGGWGGFMGSDDGAAGFCWGRVAVFIAG